MSILRADSIRDRAGTGAPNFPNGISVSNGINATGVITATSFSGAITGNVTGNVTGNADTATSATLATNAQGLTGTPNITVQDAIIQGNLTVNGTTSTIDTVITAVDSLAVEGSVGVGTTNPSGKLDVDNASSDSYLNVTTTNSGSGAGIVIVANNNNEFVGYANSLRFGTVTGKNAAGFSEKIRFTSGGTAIFKAGLAEKYNKGTTLAAASNNVALGSGNVHRFTSNESGAKTVNFTGVHSTLADGESVSFTVVVTPAGSGYINAATVDGVAPGGGLKWSGGSAPSSGGASGRDVYTFTIFKDGTATNSYEMFGAVTNYA